MEKFIMEITWQMSWSAYLIWCNSAVGAIQLDWYMLAENLTLDSSVLLFVFLSIKMNPNKIYSLFSGNICSTSEVLCFLPYS